MNTACHCCKDPVTRYRVQLGDRTWTRWCGDCVAALRVRMAPWRFRQQVQPA